MWFEVNVRLSEVTDLKWPHGTEWQCVNSTLAMSWPNHVQILSFASMASRQGAVKHGFISKIAGGCSSYDVIAPWPDLTWSIFFKPKVVQGLPHQVPQNPARFFFAICEKPQGGGVCTNWNWLKIVRAMVNPRLTGGGGVWRPPSRIFAIAQKRTALSTWNLAGLLIQQFYIVREIFFEIRRKIFEIWSILWRHYTPLLVENWPNFAGLWKTQFLMKTQMKNTNRRKMRSSTRWLSQFFKILGFWPLKFQKIDFFGKWSLKSKIFKIFKKP